MRKSTAKARETIDRSYAQMREALMATSEADEGIAQKLGEMVDFLEASEAEASKRFDALKAQIEQERHFYAETILTARDSVAALIRELTGSTVEALPAKRGTDAKAA